MHGVGIGSRTGKFYSSKLRTCDRVRCLDETRFSFSQVPAVFLEFFLLAAEEGLHSILHLLFYLFAGNHSKEFLLCPRILLQ